MWSNIYMFRIIMKFRQFSLFAIVLLFSWCVTSCKERPAEYLTIEGQALGTNLKVICCGDILAEDVVDMVREIDREAKASMSIFDETSLISRINRSQTDSLDCHIIRNLEIAERFVDISGGLYDVTVRPLTEAWGFAGKDMGSVIPNVDSLLEFVGFDLISVEEGRLVKQDCRTQLDFNSIAKGYTVDLIAEALEQCGVEDYMVSVGGEIRCKGENSRGAEWTIAIETPYEGNMGYEEAYEKILTLSNCAVATSGNYRRYHTAPDGQKVVHTLNPHTGYSVISDLLSATVVASTCAEADAAATMFMAVGSEGGALELARECEKNFGWRYYFIYAADEGYRVECSDSLR